MAYRELSKEEAEALIHGRFGEALAHTASQYIAPIWWEKNKPQSVNDINNGTIFFLNTGERVFAVTANHVYEEFCKAKKYNQQTFCKIGNLNFDPIKQLIDQSSKYDIATFNITKQEVTKIGSLILTGSQKTWPPKPPEEGKGVFFAGFPKNERLNPDDKTINFGAGVVLCIATNVTSHSLMCQLESEHTIPMNGTVIPIDDYFFGGISGAPVLTLVQNHATSWRLGGVISQETQKGTKLIFATLANVIHADGTLDKD